MSCGWKCCTFRNSHLNNCSTFKNDLCISFSHTLNDLHTLDKFSFTFRSSRSQIIIKIGVLKVSQYSQENTCVRVSIDNAAGLQPCNFIKETQTQVFSCEYCEIFKNSFFYRAPPVTASVLWIITTLNFNRVLGNLRSMNNFNFINFFSDRVTRCSMEGASYCCFRKAFQKSSFSKSYW